MNKGAFHRNCELLLIHVNNLQEKGKSKKCKATTKFLAKSIGKSVTQTDRYLKALETRGLIKRITSRFRRNTVTRKPYKSRIIEVNCTKSPSHAQVLSVYFNKSLHGRTKNRMIQEIVRSPSFEMVNIRNTTENVPVRKDLKLKLEFATSNQATSRQFMTNFEEISKIVEANEKKLEEKRFYSHLDTRCEAMLLQLWDTSVPLVGKTPIERLANVCIHNFKTSETLMEEIDPPDAEMRQLKAKTWAENTVLRDNVFYITIFLGGEIPYEIKLKDYLPWGRDSEYYKLFMEAFRNK